MYSEMQYEFYVLYKLILAMFFECNDKEMRQQEWSTGVDALVSMKDVVKHLKKNNALSSKIKNNIFDCLDYAKYIKDEDSKERNKVINEIIGLLNCEEDYIPIGFYRTELYKRTDNIKFITKYYDEEIISKIDIVNNSIRFDIDVLVSHGEDVSEQEFKESYLDFFSCNLYYYESINAILKEYPKIFKNELFYNRFRQVLDASYEKNRSFNRENKRLIKEIKKIKV